MEGQQVSYYAPLSVGYKVVLVHEFARPPKFALRLKIQTELSVGFSSKIARLNRHNCIYRWESCDPTFLRESHDKSCDFSFSMLGQSSLSLVTLVSLYLRTKSPKLTFLVLVESFYSLFYSALWLEISPHLSLLGSPLVSFCSAMRRPSSFFFTPHWVDDVTQNIQYTLDMTCEVRSNFSQYFCQYLHNFPSVLCSQIYFIL